MSTSKKKKAKKVVRQVEKDLNVDPDSILGNLVADGVASLFGSDDDNLTSKNSDSDDSNDNSSDDFGGGDFGGGGSDSDW